MKPTTKLQKPFFYTILTLWSLLILANFVPSIPQPEFIIGYLWKVEFILALFLLAATVFLLKIPKEKLVRFTKKEFRLIILPLLLFTIWSALSVFRAESARAAVHHTLLWACYAIFYLLIRQIVAQSETLNASLKITGFVLLILGVACIVEYVGSSGQVNSYFTARYYKYAEASVALMPIFLASALRTKSRASILCAVVAASAWIIAVLSLSRSAFISAIISVSLFFALAFLFSNGRKYLKKSLAIIGLLFVCFFITQINFFGGAANSTVNRLKGDETSQINLRSRLLYWEIALEEFKTSPLTGVGADNFINAYKSGRETFSSANSENTLIEINEASLAERAHNEFLQILAELGVVGLILIFWLLAGIVFCVFQNRRNFLPLQTAAALAGICAFLLNSMASSYSFRVPANGLCFFFLMALAIGGAKSKNQKPASEKPFAAWNLKPVLIGFGLIICPAMLAFSAVRAVSMMYLQFALSSSGEAQIERNFQKAIQLDSKDATIRYFYGSWLFTEGEAEKSILQTRLAIDNGFVTSIAYFNLASAQRINGNAVEAERTFAESVKLYPRSVFLRTSYAEFLKETKKTVESQNQLEIASRINERQAKSWWIVHNEGAVKLAHIENSDNSYVKAMELEPKQGIYSLLDFQSRFNPNLVRR
jgi:O-antigen ligase